MEKIFQAILEAKSVYQVAKKTPIEYAKILSKRYQNQIFIKREDLQPTHSFKIRGALNKIYNLSKDEKNKGIIAASAGNHAQGVALSAQKLGVKATIVMPVTVPKIKVNAVKSYGARVILIGDSYDEAQSYATQLSKKEHLIQIPPFDDDSIIAGQGTIGIELFQQQPDMDMVFIPVGGGGLIAGIGTYLKKLNPNIKIIGIESEDAASMHNSLEKSKRIILSQVGIFADGTAVKQIGQIPFDIAQKVVDEIILVSIDEICAAIKDIFEDNRSIAEPSGALAVAGLKKYIQKNTLSDKKLIAIESGANINFDRLRHVAERADIGEQKEQVFAATIAEQPGSFQEFCQLLGKRNITEFNYRYDNATLAQIFVGIETTEQDISSLLKNHNITMVNLSDNETAKQHVRYMVGGRAPQITDERLYRFEFPERPGALMDFLSKIGSKWNISLFHYRNHGAAFGRVLVGIQIPSDEIKELEQFLIKLNFTYEREDDNPAYQLFLS